MSRKILFSPVGGTDPMKYSRDGSMLHICRYYKPDLVYLYLSHEMMEFHKKDNRYVDAIERLGDYLDHKFEIHIIERNGLIEVQQYDVFYQEFKDEIRKIESQMEEGDEILLNMASGTPAMKSALLVMATFAEYRFKTIQVSTPKKSMNYQHEDRETYDNQRNWESNQDNLEDSPNRCMEVKSLNLMRMMKIEIIKKHLRAYDYAAALAVASEIKEDISEDAFLLIQIMDARVKSDHKKISKLISGKTYDVYPVKEGNKQKVFEYALVLQMKIKKQEYADFIRGITPLVVDLLEHILKNKCKIRLGDYSEKDKNGVRKWNREKLKRAGLADLLESAYHGEFKYGPVYSNHIANIIGHKCNNAELIQKLEDITYIEGKVRNVAAHEIVSVTDEWIQERTKDKNKAGKNANGIFDILKYLIREAGMNVKKEDWQSYDTINGSIEQQLDQ